MNDPQFSDLYIKKIKKGSVATFEKGAFEKGAFEKGANEGLGGLGHQAVI